MYQGYLYKQNSWNLTRHDEISLINYFFQKLQGPSAKKKGDRDLLIDETLPTPPPFVFFFPAKNVPNSTETLAMQAIPN